MMVPQPSGLLQAVGVPALFVVLWSTGFIGARLGLPHAGPLTFLALRFGLAAGLLALVASAGHDGPLRGGRAARARGLSRGRLRRHLARGRGRRLGARRRAPAAA